jgi:hypothetical protein
MSLHALYQTVFRFVSGGCDSLVKIWKEGEDGHWTEDTKLDAHSDWVGTSVADPDPDPRILASD